MFSNFQDIFQMKTLDIKRLFFGGTCWIGFSVHNGGWQWAYLGEEWTMSKMGRILIINISIKKIDIKDAAASRVLTIQCAFFI